MDIFKIKNLILGYDGEFWLISKNDLIYLLDANRINNDRPFLVWLPLLESEPSEIIDKINRVLFIKEFDFKFEYSFPLKALLKIGVESDSLHWIEKSIKWMMFLERNFDLEKELTQVLKSPILRKKQQLRQQIRYLIGDNSSCR